MKQRINNLVPVVSTTSYIHKTALVIGDVHLGDNVSLWPSAILRADIAPIFVGEGSNVQENSTIHVNYDRPAKIGKYVTIGHNVVVHGANIGDNCLIGMNSVVMESDIGEDCIIGAGTVLPAGKTIPAGSLVLGVPAKVVRALSEDERKGLKDHALEYVKLAELYKNTCEDL